MQKHHLGVAIIIIFSFTEENTPSVFLSYLYLAEKHIKTSGLWTDVSSESNISALFQFFRNCFSLQKNGKNASSLFLAGKKTAPLVAIKRRNWKPIGYCQTASINIILSIISSVALSLYWLLFSSKKDLMQSFYTTKPKEPELSLLINRLIICDVMFHLYIDIQKRLRMEAVKRFESWNLVLILFWWMMIITDPKNNFGYVP